MDDAISLENLSVTTPARTPRAISSVPHFASSATRTEWLIDNAEAYGPLLESLRRARRSVHIAQLAFDADCAAYTSDSSTAAPSPDAVIAEALIDLAMADGPEIRILLNATWILNTARPLRKFFAGRGVAAEQIEVRGMSRFPHFMHAKLVLIDGREAFLLGSPFVNSYWDNGGHVPFDARRPLRELGGRPLHDVSMRLRGPVVGDLEAMFAGVWQSCGVGTGGGARAVEARAETIPKAAPAAGTRVVCDAPDGVLPGAPDRAMRMLAELLAGITRARDFIYIEHQYLTSRPIVAALATALRNVPALEIIIVLNQNPDLTAYRAWQNAQLTECALLAHPRVGVFSLWSTDAHPHRVGVTRINQLFIHSKVMIVDDEWAAVGTSNLDGVSMGDYGDDFAGALGRRVFRGVRNVEVNVVIDARDALDAHGPREVSRARHAPAMHEEEAEAIAELRERLWHEHLGAPRIGLRNRPEGGWLAVWRAIGAENARTLSGSDADRPRMVGHVLPYSTRAFPSQQLRDMGIRLTGRALELCYNPTWFGVHASPHWIRNIF
jgi:phosphatidylserine/phosphatidylglycerophosphate/cardiolipin synthase-like enzyme